MAHAIRISGDQVHISFGDIETTVSISQLELLGQLVELAKRVTELHNTVSPSRAVAMASAPSNPSADATKAAPAPRLSGKKRQPAKKRPAQTARVAKPAKQDESKGSRAKQSLSEALAQWMRAHSGWRSEERLLVAVVAGQMTLANNPRLAMKIVLGKGNGTMFRNDGRKRWRLITDEDDAVASPSEGDKNASEPKTKGTRKKRLRAKAAQGSSGDKPAGRQRWDVDEAAITKARRNLLGLGT